jgi:hypothetical protein
MKKKHKKQIKECLAPKECKKLAKKLYKFAEKEFKDFHVHTDQSYDIEFIEYENTSLPHLGPQPARSITIWAVKPDNK